MNKQEFLSRLWNGLDSLPNQEREERFNFYSEMIDDRIEEGLAEEDAVAAVGSVDEITAQILSEASPEKPKKEKKLKKKHSATKITLIIAGSPLWFPLLIAAFAVIFSLYVSLWAIIVSIWSVFGALVGSGFGGIVGGILLIFTGNPLSGIAMIAAGLVLAGLSVFSFFGCLEATKGSAWLTKKIAILIKNFFTKKEEA